MSPVSVLPPRDLPRRAAPLIIGGWDVIIGAGRVFGTAKHSIAYSQVPGPLTWWGAAFVAVGVAVLASIEWPRLALPAVAVSVGVWGFWAQRLYHAHSLFPRQVSWPLTALAFASTHLLLAPYRRNRRLDGRTG